MKTNKLKKGTKYLLSDHGSAIAEYVGKKNQQYCFRPMDLNNLDGFKISDDGLVRFAMLHSFTIA